MSSAISEYRHRYGLWKGKSGRKKFYPLTNFSLRLCNFIESPKGLGDYQGYLAVATVRKSNGVDETRYQCS